MNILFVSIAFPPKNDPECIQSGRFFKYLAREKDFVLDLVTSRDPTLFMPVDESLKYLDHGYRQKISIKIFESKISNYFLRKVGIGSLMFPESKMTFHWQSDRVLKQLKNKPDLIYSRSNPISSAFMALKLKRALSIPWVMHFSDPWALSPLEKRDARKLAAEEKLVQEADHITFTTEATRQIYADHYPHMQSKFSVMHNVFDEEEFVEYPEQVSDKFTVVYTGGLAGMRSLMFLDDVLTQLKTIDPTLLDQIAFKIAGPMDRLNASYFERTAFACIRHLGMLSYDDARKLQQSAQLLLVADNPTNTQGAVFFPSKLLDYFMTGKKILAVTPGNSTTRKVLTDYDAACFTNVEVQAMALYLRDEIKQWQSSKESRRCVPPSRYSAKENATALAKLFRNTVVLK